MSDNFNQGLHKIEDFFNNGLAKLGGAFQSSNYLDSSVYLGYQGVPYAAFGMVVVFLGVMTYATIADKENGVGAAIESVGDSIASSVPAVFSPQDERSAVNKEREETLMEEKALEKEMNEGSVKGGRKRVSKKRRGFNKKKTMKKL